jgi:hypothetical protein
MRLDTSTTYTSLSNATPNEYHNNLQPLYGVYTWQRVGVAQGTLSNNVDPGTFVIIQQNPATGNGVGTADQPAPGPATVYVPPPVVTPVPRVQPPPTANPVPNPPQPIPVIQVAAGTRVQD